MMVANNSPIVKRILGRKSRRLTPEFAKEALRWRFSEKDRERASALLEKNNANELTRAETNELYTLVALGDLLDILHAQARLTLKTKTTQRIS